jgi:hypothetical protein
MIMLPARVPGIVRSYDAARRECRVEIPGITAGAETFPLAEIEYPIGDKSRNGAHATEIEILPGDHVWLAFEGGDPRFPIITGFRNPRTGNSIGWRYWHHANIELNADSEMLLKAGAKITLQVGSSTIVITSDGIKANGAAIDLN